MEIFLGSSNYWVSTIQFYMIIFNEFEIRSKIKIVSKFIIFLDAFKMSLLSFVGHLFKIKFLDKFEHPNISVL